MEQHLSVENATRAATAWAASPVGLLLRAEALVTASCALLATLVLLGSGRRTSRSAAFRFVVWLALVLSYPAVSYTIGLMQSGSFRNDMVVVWACFLLGCADGIAACSVDGSDQQARTMISQATQVFYVMLLLLSYLTSLEARLKVLLSLLWLLNVTKLGLRLWSLLAAGRDRVLTADNWLISKYMAHENVSSVWDFDPATMKGYRYVVTGDDKKNVEYQYGAGEYKVEFRDDDLVTVEKAWEQHDGSLLSEDGKLRDLCLSFALFKLLRRRLNGSPLHEPGDIRTMVFVRRGLAGGDSCDDHERMYRVIEVELGFLYDFYYARYPSPKQTLIPETATFMAAAALSLSTLFSPALLHHHRPPGGSVDYTTTSLDIWLARLVITLFLLLELFQYLSLVLSDWHKVKMLCRYVRHRPWWRRHRILEMLLWLACRATLTRSYWSNSVGQYSLLHACHHSESSCLLTRVPLHRWVKDRLIATRSVTRRSLPAAAKRQIHRLLRSEWLSNVKYGDRTLQRNDLLQELDWSTSRYEFGAMGSILVWHIATAICGDDDDHLSKTRPRTTDNTIVADRREVATVLSNYCAYLLFQAPELVTDEVHDERLLMEAVQEGIQNHLRRHKGHHHRRRDTAATMFAGLREFVRSDEANYAGECVLADGIRLGHQLLSGMPDEAARWSVLAEMWVELLLTVAPSENVAGHVKRLATGGELVTHLWALLTHGGMIKRPAKPFYGSC
ncbi:uncharacterized protein LOC102699739 [Oryza brachyantha]|uniref:DUF4220 domain-containing protein n=1 Tax=Oryza brachyantha TaxID=4533 RepID=J3NBY3_ORYBR|nr:uncharacterized protein LOC102699739 [Oryza brachyantha]